MPSSRRDFLKTAAAGALGLCAPLPGRAAAPAKGPYDFIINNDGCGSLVRLADTPMTEQDAADQLVGPLANTDVTAIDFAILTTGRHNCRTRYERPFTERDYLPDPGAGLSRERLGPDLARVIAHYNDQPLDILDIVIKHGHLRGMKVYGCIRLNHGYHTWMDGVPGPHFTASVKTTFPLDEHQKRVDFRSEQFHAYLEGLYEDLLEKGVDGISLDFERKAPFFPEDVPQDEREGACLAFLRRIRKLTDKPLITRVAHRAGDGLPQGQRPLQWMREGLVDIMVPATHNHEPDSLDWSIARFVEAAAQSPRPCRVVPQIWPTRSLWGKRKEKGLHSEDAILGRVTDLVERGSDGCYFFNFFVWTGSDGAEPEWQTLFARLTEAAERA